MLTPLKCLAGCPNFKYVFVPSMEDLWGASLPMGNKVLPGKPKEEVGIGISCIFNLYFVDIRVGLWAISWGGDGEYRRREGGTYALLGLCTNISTSSLLAPEIFLMRSASLFFFFKSSKRRWRDGRALLGRE